MFGLMKQIDEMISLVHYIDSEAYFCSAICSPSAFIITKQGCVFYNFEAVHGDLQFVDG